VTSITAWLMPLKAMASATSSASAVLAEFRVFKVAVAVCLAGGGRGRFEGRRRAGWALGVHGITEGLISLKTRRGNWSRLIAISDLPIDAVDQSPFSDC